MNVAVSTADSPAPDLTFLYIKAGIGGVIAAAAVLLLWPDALSSRWSGAALAAVHLFAVGGLAPAMAGALFQFVPVASGLALAPWGRAEFAVMTALSLGAACLGVGFLAANRSAIGVGATLAVAALALVGGRLAAALWRNRESAIIALGLRTSLYGLAGTLALAAYLAFELVMRNRQPEVGWVDWHALWAIGGWVGTLIASVATVIVPMFNVTDAYPPAWQRAVRTLPLWLLAGVTASTLHAGWPADLARVALALMAGAFGLFTLHLLRRSRRRQRDVFRWGWNLIGLAAVLSGALGAVSLSSDDPRLTTAFGVCALAGFAGITITTMVYRIVPFLIWLHWQRINKARARLPLMHEIIPEKPQTIQLALQISGIVALCLASYVPMLQPVGALLWLASQCGLLILVSRATRRYASTRATLLTLPPRVAGTHDRSAPPQRER